MANGRVRIDLYDNGWYDPGRPFPVRALWILVNGLFFQTWFPWPSQLKRALLRLFGARVGRRVVIKPRVNVKYPWKISIGDHSWIGEQAWLDSVERIDIGAHCCISQGVVFVTGAHDASRVGFDLLLGPVTVEDGAWAAAGSMLLPGSRLASHAILGARSVLSGSTEPYGIYLGSPPVMVKMRSLRSDDEGR